MPKLSELNVKEPLSILLYGLSQFGKTWFAGSAGSRTLYISVSQTALSTLTSKAFKNRYPNCDPEFVQLRKATFNEVTDIIDDYIKNKADLFDTIVIDDLTYLSGIAMSFALELNQSSRKSQTLANTKLVPLPAKQDFGTLQNIFLWFLGEYVPRIKESGKHLICIAHPRFVFSPPPKGSEDQTPKLSSVFPYVVGKDFFAPNVLPSYFDEVYYGYIEAGQRAFRTQRNAIVTAGTRHAVELKEVETNLDFPTLISKIYG